MIARSVVGAEPQGFSILIQNKNFTAKLAKGAKKSKRLWD